MGLCIGGGSVPTGTADSYLAAFGYSGPYPLADSVYRAIASQDHPGKTSKGPGGQDNWIELSVACMKARAVLFCNDRPGDTAQTVATVGQIAEGGLGATTGSLGLAGVTLAGTTAGLALGAATLGLGIGLTVALDIFQHHAQAEQTQRTVLANICPAATSAIRAIDAEVQAGRATAADAILALNQLYNQFVSAVQQYENNCNAFCWYDYIVKCLVDVSTDLYSLDQYQPAPASPVVKSGAVPPSTQHAANTTMTGFPTISQNFLMALIVALITGLLLGCAPPSHAGPWHYIKTHKTLLAADALTGVSISLDLTSKRCPKCDPQMSWKTGELSVVSFSVARHAGWHFAPDKLGRYFVLSLSTVPIVFMSSADAAANWEAKRGSTIRKRQ